MVMEGFKIAPGDLFEPTINDRKNELNFFSFEDDSMQENFLGIKIDLLLEEGVIQSLLLPIFAEGKFRFENVENSKICNNLFFCAEKGKWYVCATRPTHLIDVDEKPCYILELSNNRLIEIGNIGQKCKIYVEVIRSNNKVFHNYQLCSNQDIYIGCSDDNDIVYNNELIAKKQAIIYWKKNNIFVKNFNVTNDVWVNGRKCIDSALKLGDKIYIFGMTIIIGLGFISINDDIPEIVVRGEKLRKVFSTQNLGFQQTNEYTSDGDKFFYRLPRRKETFDPGTIVIEAPPISLNSSNIPLMLRMGGSMVMGGASALSGSYVMFLSSVLFPVLTQKYTDKEKKQYEERRLEKYRQYLEDKRREIQAEKENEERILRDNYPDLNHVLMYPIDRKQLWERRKIDDDFLTIRIGYGEIPLAAKIEYPDQHFNLEEDILEQEMYRLAETPVILNNVPIMTNFVQNFICSIAGNKQLTFSFVKRIIMMMAILHSYDEMKMILLLEQDDLHGELEPIKYIPHVWDDQRNIRYIATMPSETFQISELIKKETETDLKKTRELKDILKHHPYYVVFALSKRIFESMEILKELIQQEKTCGVSVITAFNDPPKECSLLFDLKLAGDNSIIYLKDNSRKDDKFKFDRFDQEKSERSLKCVANINLKNITQAYSLPKTITFLEMFKVGRVEHLNVLKRWSDNNPVKSLAVPVGIATDGNLFYLDLHQKYQGPHGLVAGTTGSGKSEFLITYILSMAINYHPNEVAFVLIDYKGGGLAGAFDDSNKGIHLPHLIGTITNLDGASIQRSLVSIQSELTRRQRIFSEVKSLSNEGIMDIYTYQKMYRNKIVPEPMPHLFIISDEFAELKQQQPDFMEQLISAARIGRSLGIHLILATQKPAGIVNDQIRSNTKFRVCLKVQDKADSQDMLKRPEAAELKETGRFYLQVGYNEFFALGQSGWSGADYKPTDEVIVQKDTSIQIIDSVGQALVDVKPIIKHTASKGTQLMAIVKFLTVLAKEQNIITSQLWQPELEKKIDIDDIDKCLDRRDEVYCTLGMIDDPENQNQYVLTYNLEQSQHLLIVGDASSGKTSLIQVFLYLLSSRYSPKQVNYYVLDYSSRMLKKFSKLPHCGAVLLEDDADAIDCFFELINNTVLERKRLFSELAVDNYSAAKEKVDIPLIIVFIDNISGLNNTKKGEQYSYNLHNYLKDSLNYGIKYVVTCSHLSDISSRLRQEFGDHLCLHMKDKYEYSDALNCKVVYTPPELPGRGLFVVAGRPLEIQIAMYKVNSMDIERTEILEKEIVNLTKKYAGNDKAKRIPIFSEDATYEIFAEQFSKGRIPLGYSQQTRKAIALPLRQLSVLSVYQGNPNGFVPILSNFLLSVKNERMTLWFVKNNKKSQLQNCGIVFEQEDAIRIISSEQKELEVLWHDLADEISERMDLRKKYCDERGIESERTVIVEKSWKYLHEKTEPIMLIIENLANFSQALDTVSMLVYDKLFHAIDGLNIYIIGFFAADDVEKIKSNYVYAGFCSAGTIMLFGGEFDKQSLIELPAEAIQTGKQLPFNVCLMKYRDKYHVVLMPCGEIAKTDGDPDSQDIFK